MTFWLSRPVEKLLDSTSADNSPVTVSTLIVGSGYGAAMAALALSEAASTESERTPGEQRLSEQTLGKKTLGEQSLGDAGETAQRGIVVFERGKEYLPQDFPRTLGELPGYAPGNASGNVEEGLWDVRAGERAVSISGSGLGGTSLVNASVAVPPDPETLQKWPASGVGADWHDLFSKCYPKINQLLGVGQVDNPRRFDKYKALWRTVKEIDGAAEVHAAPVAINFDGPGNHSVDHQPCNHCGNCVIGCHSGAKQSLNLNAWPLAKQRGVDLYTGVTVRHLKRDGDHWKVYCRSTKRQSREFLVIASRVILAAGSIGSTEILSRSKVSNTASSPEENDGLKLSPMLGKKFSANGDGLIFTAGEEHRVNAVASVPDETASEQVGPTIVGFARTSKGNSNVGRLTIEDGAIPYPLAEVWRETLTMQSFIRRFVSDTRSGWHKNNPSHDELASSNSLTKNSQVLLTMGFDGSPGELVADETTGNLLPVWPVRKPGEGYYHALHSVFKSAEPTAYAGGEYHPNPMLQLLPDEFTQVFAGADQLQKRVVTVHPLGGCVMGESPENGVVNRNGQVFKCEENRSDSSSVYDNLYVLDGSILPTAVGVNPMIAISALSYTLASRIAGHSFPLSVPFEPLARENKDIPFTARVPVNRDKTINARFNERLLWSVKSEAVCCEKLQALFENKLPTDTKTIVLDVGFYFEDSKNGKREYQNSLDKWLCNPAVPLRANAVLMASDKEVLHGSADTFVPMPVLMKFDGEVTLGSKGSLEEKSISRRTFLTFWRFAYYRPYALTDIIISGVGSTVYRAFGRNKKEIGAIASTGIIEQLRGFLRVAQMHTDWRYLEYDLHEVSSEVPLTISGKKELAYGRHKKSVWESLLVLPTIFERGECSVSADLTVDLLRITKGPSPLQITRAPDEPSTVAAVAGFGLLLARLVGSTHFWSFGAHNYDRFIVEKDFDEARRRKPPEIIEFKRKKKSFLSLPAEIYTLKDPSTSAEKRTDAGADTELFARLVRYREDKNTDHPAVLLVHGLSHSSEIFWPEHVSETYVEYLLSKGYDVWVFDHRTSGNTRKQVDKDHTWDDIACIDVPWAVRQVYSTINAENDSDHPRLVNIFSHCIGAGAVAMAVLDGQLQRADDTTATMVGSFVPHAVTPWVFSSCDNRTRANVWGFVKDFNLLEILDPRMHSKPAFFDTIIDRIATSTIDQTARKQWPFLKNLFVRTPGTNEYAMAMYFRYTVFWGKQWVHRNVRDDLKKRFPTMVGEVPATILQQTYFGVRRQRLVAKDANNRYVTDKQFKDYWTFPTLFLHGQSNQVFDVESSRLSARRLAGLRDEKIALTANADVKMGDYARNGIWLHTEPDYGHMDMIIGDKVTSKIGSVLDTFFTASEKQNSAWRGDTQSNNSFQEFTSCYRKCADEQPEHPLTRAYASKFPFTGPVLSYATGDSFRLWVEADDYDTKEAIGIAVAADQCSDLAITQLSFRTAHAAQRSCFRGIQVNKPENITGSVQIRLQHAADDSPTSNTLTEFCNVIQHDTLEHTGSQDLVRQRDIDHENGVTLNLHNLPWFKRLYANNTETGANDFSFIAGSCLHPGTVFSRDKSDSIFNLMWEEITTSAPGPDFLLLLGDQIYADATAGLFDPKASYERYRMRYREAFGARGLRRVLSHIPTYFVVDDHAYRDNYSGLLDVTEVQDFSIAKAEAKNFQAPSTKEGDVDLWSDFKIYQQPFFCFDTRFERRADFDRADCRSLISEGQKDAFRAWVRNNRDKQSLFLCTGSPLIPVKKDYVDFPVLLRDSDTLLSYPGFLNFLLDTLSDLKCKVFLLSGDPHLSCRGKAVLSSATGRSVTIENVVSSALNAPYPFANARTEDHVWGQDQSLSIPDSTLSLSFRQDLLSTAAQQFCRMDYAADSGILCVKVYSSDGVELGTEEVSYS